MKFLKSFDNHTDGVGYIADTPFIGICKDKNIPVYINKSFGEKVALVEHSIKGIAAEGANNETSNKTIVKYADGTVIEYDIVGTIYGSVSSPCQATTQIDNIWDAEEIILGTDISEIGECAFVNCYNLTKVVIPNTVSSIGSEAFYGCE